MKRSPFGERLRRLRRDAELNLVDLSDASGMSVAYLSAIERGSRNPPDVKVIATMLTKLGRPDLLQEMAKLAMISRRSVEIPVEGSETEVAEMLTALARRKEEGTLTPDEAKLILDILNKQQKP